MSVLYDVAGPRARRRHAIAAVLTIAGLVLALIGIIWKLQMEGQFTADKWEVFSTPVYLELIGRAILDTLRIAVLSIVLAVVFGVVFGVAKLSDHRPIRVFAWCVVEFFRAVPLLLLIIFIWFWGFDTRDDIIAPLVLGLTLYNGSVLAEVFRAGINAVPQGQVEAAYALGMRKTAVTRIVQLPQAVKIMTPAIISQCVVVLKDTSLGYYILAPGLTTLGREIWREFDNRLATALVLAAIYIVLNVILSRVGVYVQRRLTESQTVKPVDLESARAGAPGAVV
ncbi:amino acid ABC transporter permease [Aeromicrobium duanguangcaii]|uniref:amino acid ABC transporter permease n=1 Tax=Aeromicrobium duanguangcaii TaxID=2968086 RepID=UPI0020172273|nr:amino acid ABC transporter permease [Aeromicrobium duanguangcaii]MCL3837405.1 amino acid ABC transporter permease [Aeromicrobium duanguangcaii]